MITLTNGVGRQLVSDADHVELQRLVTESASRVDEGRPETLYELFVEDGVLDMGNAQFEGHEALKKWGEELKSNRTYEQIRHAQSNSRFTLIDENNAEGTTLLTVFMDDQQHTSFPWVVGEDYDTFVRTDEGWKFKSRRWVSLFMRPEAQ